MRPSMTHLMLVPPLFALWVSVGHVVEQRLRVSPHVVTIIATDYAFQLPDSIPSGVTTLELRNAGKEPHELVLVKLAHGQTLADVLAAVKKDGPDPLWQQLMGGPGGVLPGATSAVTVALDPAQYAVFCGVPGKDGMPHAMKGMMKTLTVTSAANGARAPESDVTIRMVDFDFALSTPLTAGTHTIRIVNAGSQAHMLSLIRLVPGKSVDDVLSWERLRNGPFPIAWATGASAMRAGGVVYVRADLVPGTYGLLCFLSDDTDGKSHIAHGMRKEFTVQ